jgi:hypothetical protein
MSGPPRLADLDEPPRLVRRFNGRDSTPARDELFEPDPVPLNRQLFPGMASAPTNDGYLVDHTPSRDSLFEPAERPLSVTPRLSPRAFTPRSSGSWTDSTEEYEDEDIPTWWFEIPERFRSDVFWSHMFGQPHFFLLGTEITREKRELIDRIMDLLPIKYKSMYDTSTRQPSKIPLPNVVNVAFVKQFLMNVSRVELTPEDRFRFEMMIMNFFIFAPMKYLEEFIVSLPKHGGKTRKKRRKHKTKRV